MFTQLELFATGLHGLSFTHGWFKLSSLCSNKYRLLQLFCIVMTPLLPKHMAPSAWVWSFLRNIHVTYKASNLWTQVQSQARKLSFQRVPLYLITMTLACLLHLICAKITEDPIACLWSEIIWDFCIILASFLDQSIFQYTYCHVTPSDCVVCMFDVYNLSYIRCLTQFTHFKTILLA